MYRDGSYDNWRQDAAWLNEEEAWPKTLFPDADYSYFRECGSLVCALTVMLYHSGMEETSGQEPINPWILNQRLIACGAFTGTRNSGSGALVSLAGRKTGGD